MNTLASILTIKSCRANIECSSKKRALEMISEIAAENTNINSQEIFDSFIAREKLGTTGIGTGIAIPHGRIKSLNKATLLVITCKDAIEFDSIDKQKVDILVALLVPEENAQEHLKILAAVAKRLDNKNITRQLRHANSAGEIYAIMLNPNLDKAQGK